MFSLIADSERLLLFSLFLFSQGSRKVQCTLSQIIADNDADFDQPSQLIELSEDHHT